MKCTINRKNILDGDALGKLMLYRVIIALHAQSLTVAADVVRLNNGPSFKVFSLAKISSSNSAETATLNAKADVTKSKHTRYLSIG